MVLLSIENENHNHFQSKVEVSLGFILISILIELPRLQEIGTLYCLTESLDHRKVTTCTSVGASACLHLGKT